MSRYSIKPGYVARSRADTRETTAGQYWTPDKIRMASFYQYEVYRAARRLLLGRPVGRRRVCDIGCGHPAKLRELLEPVADGIVGVDQPTVVDRLAAHPPTIEFRAMDLEAPDVSGLHGTFDLVVCADVVEHLLDPDPCVRFLGALLRPDGIAVVSTPERDVMRGPECMTSPKPVHVREWNAQEFAEYLGTHGFTVRRHALLPKGRMSWGQRLVRLLPLRSPELHGCQMVVCTFSPRSRA
ncbi:MAG: class I SAM-dependent methyltransferase [Candidatus Rokuibacteriota bacterium]